MPTAELRVLREKDRFRLTGLSRVQVWRLEREGRFPKRIQLGTNSVGWLASELDAWIAAKAKARTASSTARRLGDTRRFPVTA